MSLYLKHQQKADIARTVREQPTLTAKEFLARRVDKQQDEQIDFALKKSVASLITQERTAVLTAKLEGGVREFRGLH